MQPRFSVVIPVRNGAGVIGRAVASVLAQTFEDLEVVVVDAGSEDETLTAVRATGDHRVRILRRPSPDLADAFRVGVHAARGQWTATITATDEVRPGWLAHLARLQDRCGAAMVICGAATFDVDGAATVDRPDAAHLSTGPGTFVTSTRRWRSIIDDAPAPGSSGSIGTSIFEEVASLGETLRRSALADGGEVVETDEVLVHHRPGTQSEAVVGADQLRLRWALQAIDAIAASPIPDGERLARYASIGGTFAARLGDREVAQRLFLLASRLEPTSVRNWFRLAMAHLPATIQPATELTAA